MAVTSAQADTARELVCLVFASLVEAGAGSVRVRIVLEKGLPVKAWFYSYMNHEWHKSARLVTDPGLAAAILEQMEILVSKQQGDAWHCRRHGAADLVDTDVVFHADKVVEHLGAGLGPFLEGMLFRGTHDSGQDRRQALRHGAAGH